MSPPHQKRKCLEVRQCGGYIRRRYRLDDGRTVTSYELFEPDVNHDHIRDLLDQARARPAPLPEVGRRKPGPKPRAR
jgi:hypothetical protein